MTAHWQQRLWAIWACLALVVLGFMLPHQSEPATILGRYSPSYVVLLAVMGACVVGGLALSWASGRGWVMLPTLKTTRTSLLWISAIGIGLGLFWVWAPITTFLPTTTLFRDFVALSLVGLGVVGVWQPLMQAPTASHRWTLGLLLAVLVIGAVALVVFVSKAPPSTYFDEAFDASWGYSWVVTGNPTINLMFGDKPFSGTYFGYGFYAIGVWLKLFGISEISARLGSIVIVWACAPFVYATAKRLYGGIASAFALALALLLGIQQAYVRADVIAPLCIAIGLWAWVLGEQRFAWHFVGGFALAFAIQGHQLAVVYAVSLGVVYAWEYAQQVRHTRQLSSARFWGLLLGGACYAVIYVVVWSSTNGKSVTDFPALIQSFYSYQVDIGGGVDTTTRISTNFAKLITDFVISYPLTVIIVVVSTGLAVWVVALRRWVFIFVFGQILYVLINPKDIHTYYFVHSLPIVALLGAGVLHTLYTRSNWRVGLAVLGLGVVLQLAHLQLLTFNTGSDELIAIGEKVNALLPPEADAVVGWEVYYWGLHARHFYANYLFVKDSVPTVIDTVGIVPPKAILITQGLDQVRETLNDYIRDNHFERAICYPAPSFGWRVDVWVHPDLLPTVRNEGCP